MPPKPAASSPSVAPKIVARPANYLPLAAVGKRKRAGDGVPDDWHAACSIHRMLGGVTSNLEHYMDLLSARQKLVVSNIANADTPGYHAKDIDFQSEFRGALQGSAPNVVEAEGLTVHNDGNNVDIDREARMLAENAIRFNVAANLVRGQLRTIRMAITEGRNG